MIANSFLFSTFIEHIGVEIGLLEIVGADSLPMEALVGALLAAIEQSKKQPEAIARWTERGQNFFQQKGKRGTNATAGNPAPGAPGNNSSAPAPDRAAQ